MTLKLTACQSQLLICATLTYDEMFYQPCQKAEQLSWNQVEMAAYLSCQEP
jgi:hypothetical protein